MEPSENLHDELEAYPLRLNVAALPDRRFFKMTRTLTVSVVLLSALLIVLGVYLNYQITHLDVTVQRGGVWQFYRIDPEEKTLNALESERLRASPMKLAVEERLWAYVRARNSTVWNQEVMSETFGSAGVIAQMSSSDVWNRFYAEGQAMLAKTRGAELVRDVHIYDLKLVNSKFTGQNDLWTAIIETFDLPITDDLISVCACSDNSKACIKCKIANARNRERRRIWMRTSFKHRNVSEERCEKIYRWPGKEGEKLCPNPLGISVDKYISTFVPIHDEATYWDLPPDLRPEI